MNLTFREYEESAAKTAIYDKQWAIVYPALGVNGEAGEIAEKVKKMLRDDGGVMTPQRRQNLAYEIGDVLWYLTALCHDLGMTLEGCARMNFEKLDSRSRRDALQGSGDNR